jgi:hypothetical protein
MGTVPRWPFYNVVKTPLDLAVEKGRRIRLSEGVFVALLGARFSSNLATRSHIARLPEDVLRMLALFLF